jgi:hypothetical protein
VLQSVQNAFADEGRSRRTKALVIALGRTSDPHVEHSARPARKRLRVTDIGVMV